MKRVWILSLGIPSPQWVSFNPIFSWFLSIPFHGSHHSRHHELLFSLTWAHSSLPSYVPFHVDSTAIRAHWHVSITLNYIPTSMPNGRAAHGASVSASSAECPHLWGKSMCFRNKGHATLSSAMCQLGLEHSTCLAKLNLNNTGAVITTLQGLRAS